MKEKNEKAITIASLLLKRLNTAGFEAYLVGGCVRDMIMGIEPEEYKAVDVDIASSAAPHEAEKVFCDMNIAETGIKHGTITVTAPKDHIAKVSAAESILFKGGWNAEITTFRCDGSYSDGRHPDEVGFVSTIEEDLSRRDFTMNALACDAEGNILDLFGGKEDISRRVIRAVGDPERRFREDALRIMRALRFAACLGFDIEEETERAAFECRALLKNISAERFFGEFRRLAAGKYAGKVIRKYTEIIGEIMPELLRMKGFSQNNPYHKYDVLEHCIRTMEEIKTTKENREYMRIAALIHDIGKPDTYSEDEKGMGHFYDHASAGNVKAERLLRRMKADKSTIKRICTIIKYHSLIFEKDEALLKKWMNRFTPAVLFEILELKKADNYATGNMSAELLRKFDDVEIMMERILDESQCFSLKDLAVNGDDMIALGIERGPEIGEMLKALLDMVIEEKAANERSVLLEEAGRLRDET